MTVVADFALKRGEFTLQIDLTLRAGEVTAIVGPNAAGKTSVLRALAGLEHINAGVISMDGVVMDDAHRVFMPARDRGIGLVFQDYVLFPHLSVLENVAFGPRSHGVSKVKARATAMHALQQLHISALAARRPGSLSGGQAQRVALARALATAPRLLLLDEPLAALDVQTKNELRASMVARLREFTGCSVIVTHDPVDAMLLADRVLVIEAGHVVQDAPPAQIAAFPHTPYVAALMSLNLIRGTAGNGEITAADGSSVQIADPYLSGPAAAVIRPESVAVHRARPEGSARNVWSAVVTLVQPLGDNVRIHMEGASSMIATVTAAAQSELALAPGMTVWTSVKAVDIRSYPLSSGSQVSPAE